MGSSDANAKVIADVIMKAEIRGIPSHGMLRVVDYFRLWKNKRINIKPGCKITHETPSTATVDGDNALGMVAGKYSMKVAIEKAKKAGSGWVATFNSNHYGIAAYYAMLALKEDMIGIAMTNANPLVAPTFSKSRLLGTNPIAVAIPAKKQPPFIADFSTTPITRGKLALEARVGNNVDFGYVQDKDGYPSDNPDILKKGGAMLPLGGDYHHGSHKGYCLGALVDIFTGVFSGANFGPFIPPSIPYLPIPEKQVGVGTGHFFGAFRIDAFQPSDIFKERMDKWIDTFRNAEPIYINQPVQIPGDYEREKESITIKNGISVLPAIQDELKVIAEEMGIEFEVNYDTK